MLDWIRRRREAAHRADALVQRVLSEAERAQLRRNGFLEVLSSGVSGRKYRIPRGGSPVAVLEPDGRVLYLCLQPDSAMAQAEVVVAHKLLLEGAEEDYWQRANPVGRAMGRGFGRRLFG